MEVVQRTWTAGGGWEGPDAKGADLVLAFGGADVLDAPAWLDDVHSWAPDAAIVGCTTAGEILGPHVSDSSVVASFLRFASSRVAVADVDVVGQDSRIAGRQLAEGLSTEGLVHVLVLSDGLHVNGSELVAGLREGLPAGVQVTGGLAGDGDRFGRTMVLSEGQVREGHVAAVGFYGGRLRIGYGSLGGWDPFGPQRTVTKAKANVLYELDGRPALELYKEYLGEHAARLPASGLLFPLSVRTGTDTPGLVRTILAVDETEQTLTFAGDVPEGAVARLMKANFDRLVDGAHGAAEDSGVAIKGGAAQFAILISCVGRRLVLQQRIEEELEAVQEVLGDAAMTGFYSYGEICPTAPDADCQLHNQTMTITTLREE